MNMFARFNENPAMTLQDIKETKRYGRTDNVKTVYPTNKVCGGYKNKVCGGYKNIFLNDVNLHSITNTEKNCLPKIKI